MQNYLKKTKFFNFNNPDIRLFADEVLNGQELSPVETAVKLYYGVRDLIRYNLYVFSFESKTLSASYCLQKQESYCVPKAVLLGTLARYKGIPSRLGLADVKNHLSSQKLLDLLQSDLFVMHGYIELFLNNRWIKATPAFNLDLCLKIKVNPLEFNGESDSVFQEFNNDGTRHMEYIRDHGTFDDVPLALIKASVLEAYPHLTQKVMDDTIGKERSFMNEIKT